ncbi:uncharacterized protein ZHAS_00013129 [Anopheles sinensis]|uniref:Uncharacterized protein n=1 Tax=Anopheles sinensis TaxID=74873 RepID=A0A084W4M7_ANOSI|nr:uncharacterized protein ZHAS_00013129 [Anopheles sinensis]
MHRRVRRLHAVPGGDDTGRLTPFHGLTEYDSDDVLTTKGHKPGPAIRGRYGAARLFAAIRRSRLALWMGWIVPACKSAKEGAGVLRVHHITVMCVRTRPILALAKVVVTRCSSSS